jgi:hypothetical protein
LPIADYAHWQAKFEFEGNAKQNTNRQSAIGDRQFLRGDFLRNVSKYNYRHYGGARGAWDDPNRY